MEFYYYFIAVTLVLFMINTVIQWRFGFKNGVTGGFAIGIYCAVKFLHNFNAIKSANLAKGDIELAKMIYNKVDRKNISAEEVQKLLG
jgi:hypothetical protein